MKRIVLIVILAVLSIGAASVLDAQCNSYPTTRPMFEEGYGGYCGSYGYGCTECVDGDYNWCVTDGTSCKPGPRHNY
jgi:hypothetical protein